VFATCAYQRGPETATRSPYRAAWRDWRGEGNARVDGACDDDQHLGPLAAGCQKWHTPFHMAPLPKPLVWVGSTKEDLKEFPEEVRQVMGYALYLAQVGGKHPDAKPLRAFGGAGVLEVVDAYDGDAYRAVYTVKMLGVVYALHAFQKKSRKGIKTPQQDIELVRRRLKQAEAIHVRRSLPARGEEGEEED